MDSNFVSLYTFLLIVFLSVSNISDQVRSDGKTILAAISLCPRAEHQVSSTSVSTIISVFSKPSLALGVGTDNFQPYGVIE